MLEKPPEYVDPARLRGNLAPYSLETRFASWVSEMKINQSTSGIIVIAFGLAACSSGGENAKVDNLLTPEEAALQVFATKDGGGEFANLLEALEEGKVYARRVATTGVIEETDGNTYLYALEKAEFDVEVAKGSRDITITINGVAHSFTAGNVEELEGGGQRWSFKDDTSLI